MKLITTIIDEAIAATDIGNVKKKFFGLSEIVTKDKQRYPVTIPDRKQVSLDNGFDLVTWMRLASEIEEETSEEHSYGRNEAVRATAKIRLVVAHKVGLGEEFIDKFTRRIPFQLKQADYKSIFVLKNRVIDADHESVYNTELDATAYAKHRLTWNLYAVNLNVEYIYCQ